ncbi:MAG: chloride channel protein [Alphaproteobacteria bacterium]|nr:chloride channel protein [Alphaproteobacteria bacterium]
MSWVDHGGPELRFCLNALLAAVILGISTISWAAGGANWVLVDTQALTLTVVSRFRGTEEAKAILQGSAGRGLEFAGAKWLATLAAACSGIPGGIFAPSLSIGAGLGAAFGHMGLGVAGGDAVVLGMASYLTGVVQAPLTSAVILMEMTRDPALVGPLMLSALLARWSSGLVMPQPLYHVLAQTWRRATEPANTAGRHHASDA